jgi:hypothetical protein
MSKGYILHRKLDTTAHLASEVDNSSMDKTLGVTCPDILMVCMKERGYLRERQMGFNIQGLFQVFTSSRRA